MKGIVLQIVLLLGILGYSQSNPGEYTINNLKSNSSNSDFGPTFFGDNKIVFSSSRGGALKKKWKENNQPFLDLYEGTINADGSVSDIRDFSSSLDSKYHESSVSYTPNQETVYFTRNNAINESLDTDNNEVETDEEETGRRARKRARVNNSVDSDQRTTYLAIYQAEVTSDGSWVNIEPLPFNNRNYSVGHPTVNRDGTKLYFTSDMPGAYGGTDIFVCNILADGTYSKPKNMGRKVNTLGKEMFPYIDSKNILYFSSDSRKEGLGGLDLYAIKIYDNSLSDAIHLGEPMNSEGDDFSLILNNDINEGYFSSNRKKGRGDDDIYHFVANPPLSIGCTQSVTGIVKNTKTSKPVSGALIAVFDEKGTQKASVRSSNIGAFTVEVPCDGNFKLTASKKEFKGDKTTVTTINNPKGSQEVSFNLEPIFKCRQKITGIVKNAITATPIKNAKVFLFDVKGAKQGTVKSDSKGFFRFYVPCNASFKVMSGKDGFESDEIKVETPNNSDDKIDVALNLSKIIICKQTIKGVVKNIKTSQPIANATIILIDLNTKEEQSLSSATDGSFSFKVGCDLQFSIDASKEGYEEDHTSVSITNDINASYNVALNLKLKPNLNEIKILKNKVVVNIDPIYFDLNKANITKNGAIELNKVVAILKKYPELKIEGGSHTDSRGTAANNLELSTRRANSTVSYIINQGVESNRITAKGYGETQPVNRCVDGVRCTNAEYQLNRRTEFVILNPEVLGYID